jgi:hypothetical protein
VGAWSGCLGTGASWVQCKLDKWSLAAAWQGRSCLCAVYSSPCRNCDSCNSYRKVHSDVWTSDKPYHRDLHPTHHVRSQHPPMLLTLLHHCYLTICRLVTGWVCITLLKEGAAPTLQEETALQTHVSMTFLGFCQRMYYPMSLVGSLRGVQANPEPCNSNSNSIIWASRTDLVHLCAWLQPAAAVSICSLNQSLQYAAAGSCIQCHFQATVTSTGC